MNTQSKSSKNFDISDFNKSKVIKIGNQSYVKKGVLGRGAFGEVLKMAPCQIQNGVITNVHEDKSIALKIQSADKIDLNQSLLEANLLVRTSSRQMTPVIKQVGDKIYSTLPLVGSTSLTKKRTKDLKLSQKLGILSDLCTQLTELHHQTVHGKAYIHKDIKLPNIQLSDQYDGVLTPTLIDFGTATLSPSKVSSPNTKNTSPGTIDTTSPESYQGHPLTTQSDIYSLGIVCSSLIDTKTTKIRKKRLLSFEVWMTQPKLKILKEDLYSGNNSHQVISSVEDIHTTENDTQANLKPEFIQKSMADFLNLMTHNDPNSRPDILQSARFFSVLEHLTESIEMIHHNPQNINDILKYKNQTIEHYLKFTLEEKQDLLIDAILAKDDKVIKFIKENNLSPPQKESNQTDIAMIKTWVNNHQYLLKNEDMIRVLAEKPIAQQRKHIAYQFKRISKTLLFNETSVPKNLTEEDQCQRYLSFLREEAQIASLKSHLMSKGLMNDNDLIIFKDPVQNRKALLKIAQPGTPDEIKDLMKLAKSLDYINNNPYMMKLQLFKISKLEKPKDRINRIFNLKLDQFKKFAHSHGFLGLKELDNPEKQTFWLTLLRTIENNSSIVIQQLQLEKYDQINRFYEEVKDTYGDLEIFENNKSQIVPERLDNDKLNLNPKDAQELFKLSTLPKSIYTKKLNKLKLIDKYKNKKKEICDTFQDENTELSEYDNNLINQIYDKVPIKKQPHEIETQLKIKIGFNYFNGCQNELKNKYSNQYIYKFVKKNSRLNSQFLKSKIDNKVKFAKRNEQLKRYIRQGLGKFIKFNPIRCLSKRTSCLSKTIASITRSRTRTTKMTQHRPRHENTAKTKNK